jgi:hypothetical protein
MSRFLPKSLFGQTILILLVGLVISHAVGAWIYAGARERAVRAIGGFATAQRIANLSRLVDEAPADWRPRIVQALSDPTFGVALSSQPPDLPPSDAEGAARAVEDYVRQQFPGQGERQVRAVVLQVDRPPGPFFGPPFDHRPFGGPMGGMPRMGATMRDVMGPNFGAFGPWRGLEVAVQLGDGQWLSFATTLPQGGPSVSWRFVISMALMGLIVLAVSVWAVRRVTAPLGLLSAAADRLGLDVTALPVAEVGSIEMQKAARAFNRMQERLRRLIESRTQMLAALSHDLRTPLTLLRLRTEEVADPAERDKMLATIGEMDEMIATTLAFAREEVRAEPCRHCRTARERGGRYDRRRVASKHDAGRAADLRLPTRCAQTRAHQSARQRGEIRQARAGRGHHRGQGDRDQHRRRGTWHSRIRAVEGVSAVLSHRGFTQS